MSEDATKRTAGNEDVALLYGRTEDGRLRALRSRQGRIEHNEMRPLKEGYPINDGEVVSLTPREDSPLLWNVQVHYSGRRAERSHPGPAQVATDRYRENWETIFGGKDERELN